MTNTRQNLVSSVFSFLSALVCNLSLSEILSRCSPLCSRFQIRVTRVRKFNILPPGDELSPEHSSHRAQPDILLYNDHDTEFESRRRRCNRCQLCHARPLYMCMSRRFAFCNGLFLCLIPCRLSYGERTMKIPLWLKTVRKGIKAMKSGFHRTILLLTWSQSRLGYGWRVCWQARSRRFYYRYTLMKDRQMSREYVRSRIGSLIWRKSVLLAGPDYLLFLNTNKVHLELHNASGHWIGVPPNLGWIWIRVSTSFFSSLHL